MPRKPYNIDEPLEFGKYNGQILMDVCRDDPNYIQWALENADCFEITSEAQDWFEALVANVTRGKSYGFN